MAYLTARLIRCSKLDWLLPLLAVSLVISCLKEWQLFQSKKLDEIDESIKKSILKDDVCYGDLGCFSLTGNFFNALHRPVIEPPDSPESIGTKFLLYTHQNPSSPATLVYKDAGSMLRSTFSNRRPTKLVIHGFLGDGQNTWMDRIRLALLEKFDCNVIQVCWSGGAFATYNQATSNTRVVGAVVAQMLLWLEQRFNVKRSDIHIIGFSLGAHVSGYAGERMRATGEPIARITGLDPAGPYFEGTQTEVRLDPTDAKFVDVMHTDAGRWKIGFVGLSGGLGIKTSVGHVDFFVNGGRQQPGCSSISSISHCDHSRATELFIATLNSETAAFASFACESYDNFLTGDCGSNCPADGCPAMGYWSVVHQSKFTSSSSLPNNFYLLTSSKSPWYMLHYHVTLQLSSKSASGRTGKLQLHLTLDGRKCENNRLKGKQSLEPGMVLRGVFGCSWQSSKTAPELQVRWKDQSYLGKVFTDYIEMEKVKLVEIVSDTAYNYCSFDKLPSGVWARGTLC